MLMGSVFNPEKNKNYLGTSAEWESLFLSFSAPEEPKDLGSFLNIAERGLRYKTKDYPPGVFEDNVRKHAARLVTRLLLFKWDELPVLLDRGKLERLFWIHDIPELGVLLDGTEGYVRDATSVEKETDAMLANKVKESEKDIAGKIFSEKDFRLFILYDGAGDLLKGKEFNHVDPEALVAYLLDKVDGNTFFHFFLSRWIDSDRFDAGFQIRPDSLDYTMKQADRFMTNLEKIKDGHNGLYVLCRQIIYKQLEFVRNVWGKVEKKQRIPLFIKNSSVLDETT